MTRLSMFALARRRLVAGVVLVLALAGGGSLALLLPTATESFDAPGLPAYEANHRITTTYGTGGRERPFVPVITLPPGTTVDSPGTADALRRAFHAIPDARVVSYADSGDRGFAGADGRVTFGLVFGRPVAQGGIPGSALGEGVDLDERIEAAMRPHLPPGATLHVTGLDQLATGEDTGGLNVPVKLLITIAAALVVLVWVFRSRLAFVPLLISFVAVPISFLGLLALSAVTEIHETTLTMAPLFGIGIAIDYALILVTRWREERARGADAETAVHQAMRTSGHAILFSSLAVAVGLATMIVLPIPFLRSLGLAGTMVTAASALVTLTLLPIVLARHDKAGDVTRELRAGRAWSALAGFVVRRKRLAAGVSAAVLALLAVAALDLDVNPPVTANLDHSGPGHDGLVALTDAGIPSGTLTAFDVYVPPGADPDAVAATLAGVPGVHTVAAPAAPAWRQDGSAVLTVLPVDEGAPGRATIQRVLDAAPDGVLVGGYVPQQLDFAGHTYGAFGWMLALLSLVMFVVLARAFRSLLLPLKAIVLNLLSVAAVFGAMVVLWQWGWGTEAVLGVQPDGVVGTFLPVTIFAFLFGLSMDYEVFVLARVREEYDRRGDTGEAVVAGIARTGRLVTSAALILFFSFGAMATGGELDVTMFASGMALGIILDATVIRSVLVPATVALMGRWNWWLPSWAARLLRVPSEPAPLASSA